MVKEAKYKSPRHKLTTFFEKSRDQWKEKCLKAKSKGKQLSNRVRFLENSKENLKIKSNYSALFFSLMSVNTIK
jgi:hypothetical protein